MFFFLVVILNAYHHQTIELPKGRLARMRLAREICAEPALTDSHVVTLKAIGHDALPALLEAGRAADDDRNGSLRNLIIEAARPSDTKLLYEYRVWIRGQGEAAWQRLWRLDRALEWWLENKGDPEFLVPIYLPRFKPQEKGYGWMESLPYLLRSRRKEVIVPLLDLAKDAGTDRFLREAIVNGIAQSERPEAVAWLRSSRPTLRRRSTPNPELPSNKDSDSDGLMDDIDANPYVAPRKLTEEERVLQVALESQSRWLDLKGRFVALHLFGRPPFEVVGIDGTVVDRRRITDEQAQEYLHEGGYKYFGLSAEMIAPPPWNDAQVRVSDPGSVRLKPRATEAVVDIGVVWAGLGGYGCVVWLRKIKGEWFVVRSERTWVA